MNQNTLATKIQQRKKLLRQQYLAQRKQITSEQWIRYSQIICSHLANSSLIQQGQVILSYLSFNQEPDLSLLHQNCEYTWGLPRCQGKNLVWHQYQPEDKLIKGMYGIDEPHPDSSKIAPNQVDLILIPAIAIDRCGNRLGYGGGYYDRLLSQKPWQDITTIGIIFSFAYVAQLETESWDQPLDYVCTELGLEKIEPI